LRAFWEEMDLPSIEVGPFEREPLMRDCSDLVMGTPYEYEFTGGEGNRERPGFGCY
jgi:hypothetical protein